MSRKLSTRLSRQEFSRHLDQCETIHVDLAGIYTNGRRGSGFLEMYSHDYTYVARWPCSDTIWFVQSSVCASFSAIYEIPSPSLDSGLTLKYSVESDRIRNVKHHPIRDTYFVECSNHIFELDSKFREIDRVELTYTIHVTPSDSSRILYTCGLNRYGSQLSIMCDSPRRTSNYIVRKDDTCHTLLTRPNYSDMLTMIYDDRIETIDLWHSSVAAGSVTRAVVHSAYGAYIDSNVWVLSDYGNALHIADYRCGLVHTRKISGFISRVWGVNARAYVSEWPNLLVLD